MENIPAVEPSHLLAKYCIYIIFFNQTTEAVLNFELCLSDWQKEALQLLLLFTPDADS